MKDEVEKLRPQIDILVNDAYALGRGQTDRLANDYVNPDKSIAERILALIQKAQVEAVRAELERVILGSTPPYLTDGDLQDGWNHGVAKYKENLLMKAGLLAQPSKLDRLARLNTEGDEWETEPLSPEEVLKVQEETDREIRSE